MSSIHELLKQVYPLNLRMELFNAIWTGWRADIKEKDQRIAELEEQLKNATKQVRKEVCEEVYKKCEPLFRLVNNYDNGDVIERNELVDILEQIQGE